MDLHNVTPDLWISDPDRYLSSLTESWSTIPVLTLSSNHTIREGQLVRFHGMIQDMTDPVIYLSKFEVRNEKTGITEKRCGKYRDAITVDDDEIILNNTNYCENGDRRSYYCISIPGLNDWIYSTESRRFPMGDNSADRSKRPVDDDDEIDMDSPKISESKRQDRTHEGAATPNVIVQDTRNFPVESVHNYSCIVNIYDGLENSDDGHLHLNEEVEFVGFVNFSSNIVGDGMSDLPSTMVPRLHVVSFRRAGSLGPLHSCLSPSLSDEVMSRVEKVRSDLLMVLTILLLGDTLAAEYLLCNLISKIYRRLDTVTLGKLSINITNVPLEDNYPLRVYQYLTKLVPKSHYLPIDLATLNTTSFLPRKDYDNNRLITGTLQLSNHTHLFIDETKLGEGKLIEKGVMNLKALQNVILYQKLNCEFMFSNLEYPVDFPVIVMSEGISVLPCDICVRLCTDGFDGRPLSERLPSFEGYPTGEALDDTRAYLAAASRDIHFSIPDDMMQVIQEQYVRMRQEDNKTSEFDLHNLLVLSRLLALSHGEDVLSRSSWEKAVTMETERKARQINAPTSVSSARVL